MQHYNENTNHNNQHQADSTTPHLTDTPQKEPWVTPTLQILDISQTAGGDQSMAESNDGVFS